MKAKKAAIAMSGSAKSLRSRAANRRVAVALSGGVDSGVAAALLVKKGYQCTGFHLHFWKEPGSQVENKCCDLKSLQAARKTAQQLDMPFYTVDMAKLFKKKVVDSFLETYSRGLTPNPCVICNKFIKFGQLFDYVRGLGYDYLATGHYARTYHLSPITYRLLSAMDKTKDQTYFLYNLTQKHLRHILFPVGDYLKKQVRQMAKKWHLPAAQRPESQEICFLTESDYRPFLQRHIYNSIKSGEIIDVKGKIIGQHQGLPLYTIGQRHGFEVNPGLIGPFYVIAKKIKKNQLVVGFGQETEQKNFKVKKVNWISGRAPKLPLTCEVRIRHQGELFDCRVIRDMVNGKRLTYHVSLSSPQRGIAPGQSAVFYVPREASAKWGSKHEVLGGGVITNA